MELGSPVFCGRHGRRPKGAFSTADQRVYDAWGNVRGSDKSGDPKGRYCANLGHKVDDESSLIYMRARYYDPSSGRFVSEDPDRQGANLTAYCDDDPTSRADLTGASGVNWFIGFLDLVLAGICFALISAGAAGVLLVVCIALIVFAILMAAVEAVMIGQDGIKAGLGAPWNGEDTAGAMTGGVDQLKESGGLLAVVGADLELDYWLADDEDGGDA